MKPKPILWIIDGWTYWDKTNGNSYHLSRITHTRTGKSVILQECEGNARSYIDRAQRKHTGNRYPDLQTFTATIEAISFSRFRQMLNSGYWKPAQQYINVPTTRKGIHECRNITVELINKLRRTSK